jgi:hypothetical protein
MRATLTDREAVDEQQESRLDRELIELLNELRVVLPGVQALFAFLLVVPFNNRFAQVTQLERLVYALALITSALACALFITVPSFHRLRFREHDKDQLIEYGNRATIAGLGLLAIAMSASVFLIFELLFGFVVGLTASIGLAALLTMLWWGLPLVLGANK